MEFAKLHSLGSAAEARRRLDTAFSHYAAKFPQTKPELSWTADDAGRLSFHVLGQTVDLSLRVSEADLVVKGELPLWLRPFRQRAEEVVEREIERWLATP